MRVVQTVRFFDGAVWTMALSADGTHLAAAGQDKRVAIWAVTKEGIDAANAAAAAAAAAATGATGATGATAGAKTTTVVAAGSPTARRGVPAVVRRSVERHRSESEGNISNSSNSSSSNMFTLTSRPQRVFVGHEGPVVDLSWASHRDYGLLLTASLDKTVRLGHRDHGAGGASGGGGSGGGAGGGRGAALAVYQHTQLVTAVRFHPSDDGIFLTAAFDRKLRLWGVQEGQVLEWAQTRELPTALAFTEDGAMVLVGDHVGTLTVFHARQLKYYTEVACRNKHGRQRKGRKVTGVLPFFVRRRGRGRQRQQQQPPGAVQSRTPGKAAAAATAARQQTVVAAASSSSSVSSSLSSSSSSSSSHSAGAATAATAAAAAAAAGGGGTGGRDRDRDRGRSMRSPPHLLVTTNDSRLRLLRLGDFAERVKCKGHVNGPLNRQVRACASDDGAVVACGSEDGLVYMWHPQLLAGPSAAANPGGAGGGAADSSARGRGVSSDGGGGSGGGGAAAADDSLARYGSGGAGGSAVRIKDQGYEAFAAHDTATTATVFAPTDMWPPAAGGGTAMGHAPGRAAAGERPRLATTIVSASEEGEMRVFEAVVA